MGKHKGNQNKLPAVKKGFHKAWISLLEYYYINDDVFLPRTGGLKHLHAELPGIGERHAANVSDSVRRFLIRSEIVKLTKVNSRVGLVFIHREAVPDIIKAISIIETERSKGAPYYYIRKQITKALGHTTLTLRDASVTAKIKTVVKAGAPKNITPETKSEPEPTTRSERVIAALYKRCLEYKREVAEMVDELAACRASVHEASRNVNMANNAIHRADGFASQIDLTEVGINPEEI